MKNQCIIIVGVGFNISAPYFFHHSPYSTLFNPSVMQQSFNLSVFFLPRPKELIYRINEVFTFIELSLLLVTEDCLW